MQLRKIMWLTVAIVCIPKAVWALSVSASSHPQTVKPTLQFTQQPNPNQEALPEITPEPQPLPAEETEPILEPSPEPDPSAPSQTLPESAPESTIAIREIRVQGNSILQAEIDRVRQDYLQEFQRRPITTAQVPEILQEVADAITQLYLNAGYLTSRAVPLDSNPNDQVFEIQVYEGSLPEANITITWADGRSRPQLENYARQRILLGAETPLRLSQLEDQLRLLRVDPLFENVEASLRLSGTVGESALIVTLTQADPFQANISVDNYSPPSVGSERFGIHVGYLDLLGTGDSTSLAYARSIAGGADVLVLNYQVPVNPMNGTLQLRTAFDWTNVIDSEFEELNIEGESRNYQIGFRQPIIRTPRQEFALAFSFNYRDGQTFLFDRRPTPFVIGVDEDGVSRTNVLRFSQDYINRSVQGAWVVRSQFNLGIDLLDATTNESPVPDGQFFSWLIQAQRIQRLGDDHLLIVQADLQLTPDSLLPSEQFVIGGGQSLRGYRQNSRSGDNGVRFSIEDRITLITDASGVNPTLQVAPFLDLGLVWNHPDNPNTLPDQTFLAGMGLGILWEPLSDLLIRLDGAVPLIDLDDQGDNLQDQGIYFSVSYQF
ncbi:MAG: ShlB/FhaC/HecB family hemolysin secretion/activation protein [Cyanobacteria bacterium CRU_2_1]|nr:ShlB/FhaC/HecB family hemolysin secretion/activation protein [Cyanobacteria bacterium RU_5_0]NJR59485.1 ShlB/FhaC/HecB family hemolysin secretion/activation protein [Cyanobacteria bacterium CRU_2_1]